MPKEKTKANELTNADVQFISIVPKGANKIPFRILKSEDGKMKVDIKSLFSNPEDAPTLSAIIVNKSAEDIDAIKSSMALAGYAVDNVEEKDGVLIFKQEEIPEGHETYLMKYDDEMAVQFTARKAFSPYGGSNETSFADLFAQSGVLPSLCTMTDVLRSAIANILFDEDTMDPDDAASQIKKTVAEFSAMVVELVANIPVKAFKMEVQKASKKPYGNVTYADPGYQKDKKKRYPVDTEEHIRAAWSYISKEKNADEYTPGQVAAIKKKIVSAWKKVIDPKGPPSAVSKESNPSEKDTEMKTKDQVEKTSAEAEDAAAEDKETVEKAKAKADAKEMADDKDEEDESGTDDGKKGKAKAKKAKASSPNGDTAEDGEDDAQGDDDADDDTQAKKKKTKKEDAAAEVTLADVLKAVTGLNTEIAAVKKTTDEALAEVKKQLGDVAKVAKSASEAIDGLALTDGDDDRTQVTTKKSAQTQYKPLRDTGFDRAR